MDCDIPGKVAADLLSIPPLVFRIIRSKLINAALADIEIDVKLSHLEILTVLKEEGTLHPAEIGKRLLIAKAQMTHLVDKLVELFTTHPNMLKKDKAPVYSYCVRINATERWPR